MEIGADIQVLFTGESSQVLPGKVVALLDPQNADPLNGVAPVSAVVFGRRGAGSTFFGALNVYQQRSEGGNAPLDSQGAFGFLVDDLSSAPLHRGGRRPLSVV